jgi:hypothetical protein
LAFLSFGFFVNFVSFFKILLIKQLFPRLYLLLLFLPQCPLISFLHMYPVACVPPLFLAHPSSLLSLSSLLYPVSATFLMRSLFSTPTVLLALLSYLLSSVLFVLAGSPLSLASLLLLSCIILPLRLLLPLAISTLVGKAYTLPNLLRPRLSLL